MHTHTHLSNSLFAVSEDMKRPCYIHTHTHKYTFFLGGKKQRNIFFTRDLVYYPAFVID